MSRGSSRRRPLTIVDELLLRLRVAFDHRERGRHLRFVHLTIDEHPGPAEHRVERRAQLVRERGQELILEAAADLRIVARGLRVAQRAFALAFGAAAIRGHEADADADAYENEDGQRVAGSEPPAGTLVPDHEPGHEQRRRDGRDDAAGAPAIPRRNHHRGYEQEHHLARAERLQRRRGAERGERERDGHDERVDPMSHTRTSHAHALL
jgi:hypothetical protein